MPANNKTLLTLIIYTDYQCKHNKIVTGQSMGDLSLCHSRESGNPDGIDSPVTLPKAGAWNDRIPPFSDPLHKISVISGKKNKYFYLLIVFAIMVLSLNTHPALAGKPPEGDKGWVYEAKGKRDPFIALVTPDGRIIEPPKPKERTEGPPRLEGLMYDAKSISYAVMDGEVFRAGDMVGDYQIKRIDSNKVIMQKADRVFEVELNEAAAYGTK